MLLHCVCPGAEKASRGMKGEGRNHDPECGGWERNQNAGGGREKKSVSHPYGVALAY